MDNLKRNFEHLECKRDDIREELEYVEISSRKKPRREVINWLKSVENAKDPIQQLAEEVSLRSGLVRRLQLERRVDDFTTKVRELNDQSKFGRGLTLDADEGVALLTKRLVGKEFERNKKRIWDCLTDGNDSFIGVYGMGGVGKTTLLKHIHNQLIREHIKVYWVTVSQDFSIRKLQNDIARAVNLDISEIDDEMIRAAELAKALKSKKDFVLILDDVWEHICVDKVGIPVGENGCKLILTTRSEKLCSTMQCKKSIKVEPLSPKEAWILFMETLGNEASLSCQIEEIAKSLVEECRGLPLGIIVMAASMRGVEDIHEWRNALKDIEASEWNDDMEEVFRVLKYSYDKLKDPKLQECLLYCTLFPEDALIPRDELIEYYIVEKLVDGRESRQSEFDKGHSILSTLERLSLLEGGIDMAGNKCVKMHDLVRDMAIKIASSKFLIQAGMRLTDIPNEEKWSEDLVRVSLMGNYISEIPLINSSPPRCPRLLTLLLRDNENLELEVDRDDFFMHMKMLSVLDLSNTCIESLPTSISNLQCLTALLLSGCELLWDVPSLENLTDLRRLDLSFTAIRELPKGMEKLINLRYLNLYGCSDLKNIPDGILSQLSHIQYFKSNMFKLRGAEIAHWRELENFRGTFYHIDDLNTCVKSWEEREANISYDISVGSGYYGGGEEFKQQVRMFGIDVAPFVLPKCVEYLEVRRFRTVETNLSHMVGLRVALRRCYMAHCDTMRHVICSCCCNVLLYQSLEILTLLDVPMLTDLIERQEIPPPSPSPSSSVLPINAFSSLKELEILACGGLKRLFTLSLLLHLQSLERLKVEYCEGLVEIIGEISDQDEAKATIISIPPKLSYLELSSLPKLESFCSWSLKISNSLEEVHIIRCPNLKRMTLLWEEPDPPASLRRVEVEKSWWDSSLEWKHPQTKAVLQPFVIFEDEPKIFEDEPEISEDETEISED